MAMTIKYSGLVDRWPELAITGKQSNWRPGQQEERSDSEAALLLATGLFTLVHSPGRQPVAVAGAATVGSTLSAVLAPGWTASGFQWTKNGVDISGATTSSYTLLAGDVGAQLSVRASGLSYSWSGGVRVVAPAPASGTSALARFFAAVDNRDNEAVRIVGMGDSWMEYRTASAFGKQWTQLIQAQLRNYYPTTGIGATGGVGYIPFQNVSIFSPYANPFVISGTIASPPSATNGGLGLRYTLFQATGDKAVATVTGTSAVLHHLKGTGTRTMYYKVDGGAAVTFETGGYSSVSDDGFKTIPLGAAGQHTLEIGYSAGSISYGAGVFIYNGDENKGFNFYEGGHTAYRTTDYVSGAPGADALTKRIAAINPHLFLLALGQNDFAQGSGLFISAAQFKANLKAIIAQLRAAGITASILLVMSADVTAIKNAGQTSSWADFQQAAREVAAEDALGGVALVSITDSGRIPASTGSAGGLWADPAHLNDSGLVIVSDVIFQPLKR